MGKAMFKNAESSREGRQDRQTRKFECGSSPIAQYKENSNTIKFHMFHEK